MCTSVSQLLDIQHPLIQAPMAGGPTSPELVAAVSAYSGLGSLGAGYMSPEALQQAIDDIRARTRAPFHVNLFVPASYSWDQKRVDRSNAAMAIFRRELGLERPEAVASVAADFKAQFELLLAQRPALVSTTFGALSPDLVSQLQQAGSRVAGTATTTAEAQHLASAGVDMVIVQGHEAGGHRGSFLAAHEHSQIGLLALLPQVVDAIDCPVIASGGIMDGRGIAAARCLGASGVQLGSAFLATYESGAQPVHKKALTRALDTDTVLTRAFSGKPARGIANRFSRHLDSQAADLPDYPVQNAWTRDIRAAAARQQRADLLSLWAGQAAGLAQQSSAASLMDRLIKQANQIRPGCI